MKEVDEATASALEKVKRERDTLLAEVHTHTHIHTYIHTFA